MGAERVGAVASVQVPETLCHVQVVHCLEVNEAERERERDRESECERESVCVCVCVCVSELLHA